MNENDLKQILMLQCDSRQNNIFDDTYSLLTVFTVMSISILYESNLKATHA